MPITKSGGVITEVAIRDDDQAKRTGVYRNGNFSLADQVDVLKQLKFDTSGQASNTQVSLKTPAVSADESMTLEAARAENAIGNSGASKTVDLSAFCNQSLVVTGAPCVLTFVDAPAGSTVLLKLVQGSGGSKTITWPASVKWPAGSAPVLSTSAAAVDIVTLYFDGTNYYGVSSLNFS